METQTPSSDQILQLSTQDLEYLYPSWILLTISNYYLELFPTYLGNLPEGEVTVS